VARGFTQSGKTFMSGLAPKQECTTTIQALRPTDNYPRATYITSQGQKDKRMNPAKIARELRTFMLTSMEELTWAKFNNAVFAIDEFIEKTYTESGPITAIEKNYTRALFWTIVNAPEENDSLSAYYELCEYFNGAETIDDI
jgi:hypothetical protein